MARLSRKLVAVVVPLSNREELTAEENISLRHLTHFLGKYDKYFVVSKSHSIRRHDFGVKIFPDKFFGSVAAHSRLMLSPHFYNSFRGYKYILIDHLDSLVFSDQLLHWCEAGFDYIGAPWIKYDGAPYAGRPGNENKVGNGGFSLRKIESFLSVIYSRRYCIDPAKYWQRTYAPKKKYIQWLNLHKKFFMHLNVFNNARREMFRYPWAEETFWANRAVHYYPEFNIAPLETALFFAFECGPRICFEKTGHTLPFGCHAWQKYDRQFWEPYVLR
jgi:hypothetical protein